MSSVHQDYAMRCLAVAPLTYTNAGYANAATGVRYVSPNTIEALARRRYCSVERAGKVWTATITRAGQARLTLLQPPAPDEHHPLRPALAHLDRVVASYGNSMPIMLRRLIEHTRGLGTFPVGKLAQHRSALRAIAKVVNAAARAGDAAGDRAAARQEADR